MAGKLHGPYRTDAFACKIYGTSDKDGGDTTVLDIRGWGYLTGQGHGALGMDHGPAFDEQKEFAQRVVDALNAAEGYSPTPHEGQV